MNETLPGSFEVTFTCTCGDEHTEHYLINRKSLEQMLTFLLYLLDNDVESITINQVLPDGRKVESTNRIMWALTMGELGDL